MGEVIQLSVTILGKVIKKIDKVIDGVNRILFTILLDDWSTVDLTLTENTLGEIPKEQDWAYFTYMDDSTFTIVSMELRPEEPATKITYEEQRATSKSFDRILLEISLKSAKVIKQWANQIPTLYMHRKREYPKFDDFDPDLWKEPTEELFEPESCTMKFYRSKVVLSPHTVSRRGLPLDGYGFFEILMKEFDLDASPFASATLYWSASLKLRYILEVTGEKQEIESLVNFLQKHPTLPY